MRSMLRLRRTNCVQVWVVRISTRLRTGPLMSGLSRAERQVARNFLDRQARTEYVASRFLLRALASRYLCVRPQNIELHRAACGRPRLVDASGTWSSLEVSLSHCLKGIAIAFGPGSRVGVDIDLVERPLATTEAISQLSIDSERNLTTPRQIWDCWSRKEALLKGLGVGLSGLNLIPPLALPANLVRIGEETWNVVSMSAHADCSLAVAVEGVRRRIKLSLLNRTSFFQWRY